ncbi:MAG: hypothetical protein K5871_03305 [Lachnospiraceae bacterium]|nr:hypothetical protein [Lachnospiraceae bacterium]
MKTDKNALFRAIGDIDDRYVLEVLNEDEKGSGTVRKKSPVIKYLPYALPAAAGLLIAFVCVRSFVLVGNNSTATSDSAAAPTYSATTGGMSESAEESCDDGVVYNDASAEDSYDDAGFANTEAAGAMETDGVPVEEAESAGEDLEVSGMQIANPFITCSSLEEAAEIAGFSFDIPERILDEYDEVYINAIEGELFQVICYRDGSEIIRLRKGIMENISGDYNEYPYECGLSGDYPGRILGDSEDSVRNVTWSYEGYYYSLTAGSGMISEDEAMDIIVKISG